MYKLTTREENKTTLYDVGTDWANAGPIMIGLCAVKLGAPA